MDGIGWWEIWVLRGFLWINPKKSNKKPETVYRMVRYTQEEVKKWLGEK